MRGITWARLHRPWRDELDTEAVFEEPREEENELEKLDISTEEYPNSSPASDTSLFRTRKVYPKSSLPDDFNLRDENGSDLKPGAPNFNEAFVLEYLRRSRLRAAFARIVSKIAEDLAGWPVEGDDEWSIPTLMQRRITREHLANCRQSREKEALVVILDTSGSCLPQARFYNSIAAAAVQSGDVELYAAPNAGLRAQRTRQGWIGIPEKSWPFQKRTIIFFGDFDGGDAVVEASWRNTLYWFCSEGTRYPSMRQHPWCSYNLKHFKGKYYNCNDEQDFIRLLKKII